MMVLAGLLVSNNKGDGHHYDTDSGNCPYSKMFIEEQNSQYYSGKRLKSAKDRCHGRSYSSYSFHSGEV